MEDLDQHYKQQLVEDMPKFSVYFWVQVPIQTPRGALMAQLCKQQLLVATSRLSIAFWKLERTSMPNPEPTIQPCKQLVGVSTKRPSRYCSITMLMSMQKAVF